MAESNPEPRNELFRQLRPVCVAIGKLAITPPEEDKQGASRKLGELLSQLLGLLDLEQNPKAAALDARLADFIFFPLSYVFRQVESLPWGRVVEPAIRCLRILISRGWGAKIAPEVSQQLLLFLTLVVAGVPGGAVPITTAAAGDDDSGARRQPVAAAGSSEKRQVPEETEVEVYGALASLFGAAGLTSAGSASLVEAGNVSALGHSVSAILDGIVDGRTSSIQIEALAALRAAFRAVREHRETLANLLPGTASGLAKVLSPPMSQKTQRRVLVRALEVLGDVLTTVLGDIRNRDILKEKAKEVASDEGQDGDATKEDGKVLSRSWLTATAAQVKLVLAGVLKLRNRDSDDLRLAVEKLCITLLDECHESLSNCQSILVETAMMLSRPRSDRSIAETGLEDLAVIYPELGDVIKATIYNWTMSLQRIMQASDDRIKQQAIRSLARGNRLIAELQLDSSSLDDSLATALVDSVTTLIGQPKPVKILADVGAGSLQTMDLMRSGNSSGEVTYQPIMMTQESELRVRGEILDFLSGIESPALQSRLTSEMLHYVRESSGTTQVAAYWLALELAKAWTLRTRDADSFLDLTHASGGLGSHDMEVQFQELYDFSVHLLSSYSDTDDEESADWRMSALALECTALAASRAGEAFRPELIDVLYPVAAFLGAREPILQQHAIATLNSLAASCGYGNVAELLVDNADYLVDAVSLRLNTFDVSPASTAVMRMTVRLTGPRLIPFLDDVVASIFSALENFHGYPRLVEDLFSVLGEIVEQGAASDVLLLKDSGTTAVDHKKKAPQPVTLSDIAAWLKKNAEKEERRRQEEAENRSQRLPHPKEPWKSEFSKRLEREASLQDEDDDESDPSTGKSTVNKRDDDAPPKQTPTYALLTTIATHAQHHLTSPLPTLRRSLLLLLATAAPALAPNERAFLPLVNAIWPVVIARIRDREPYVAVAACDAVAALCRAAGDFMATRIKSEWKDEGLGKWLREAIVVDRRQPGGGGGSGARRITAGVGAGGGRDILLPPRSVDDSPGAGRSMPLSLTLSPGTPVPAGGRPVGSTSGSSALQQSTTTYSTSGTVVGSGSLGRFAQSAQLRAVALRMLTSIVAHVRLDDDIFDEILDIVVMGAPEDLLAEADGNDRGGSELRQALEAVNADAVWLARYRLGGIKPPPETPRPVEGFVFPVLPVPKGITPGVTAAHARR